MGDLNAYRISYSVPPINRADLDGHPFKQFQTWFADAKATERMAEYNAMHLATSSPNGLPHLRMVIMAEHDENGLVFYSHKTSPKIKELSINPRVSVCFMWHVNYRSVRVEGRVEEVSAEQSDKMWNSKKPNGKAVIQGSNQSAVIADKAAEMQKVKDLEKE